jgi:hypothetical protein
VSALSDGVITAFINDGPTAVIAGADPTPVAAGGTVAFQAINDDSVTPSDFTRNDAMGPLSWVMCDCEECQGGDDVTTTPAPDTTPAPETDETPAPGTTPAPTTTTPEATTTPAPPAANPPTGIALAIIPTVLAAGAAVALAKKRK